MTVRALVASASLLLAACRRPEAAPTASTTPTPPTAAAAAAASPASVSAPAPPSASASAEPAATDPVVMELRKPMLGKRLTLTASGRAERVIESDFVGVERSSGRVSPASVEAFHAVLRKARFCELAPNPRESAPGSTVIEARFPDVACRVDLPDARWEKVPAAKKVIDAASRLEADAFPGR